MVPNMLTQFSLMLAVLFMAAEKHKATFIAPIGVGLALFASLTISFIHHHTSPCISSHLIYTPALLHSSPLHLRLPSSDSIWILADLV